MKSEKKDYINNQETTAAYYKKPNQKNDRTIFTAIRKSKRE